MIIKNKNISRFLQEILVSYLLLSNSLQNICELYLYLSIDFIIFKFIRVIKVRSSIF